MRIERERFLVKEIICRVQSNFKHLLQFLFLSKDCRNSHPCKFLYFSNREDYKFIPSCFRRQKYRSPRLLPIALNLVRSNQRLLGSLITGRRVDVDVNERRGIVTSITLRPCPNDQRYTSLRAFDFSFHLSFQQTRACNLTLARVTAIRLQHVAKDDDSRIDTPEFVETSMSVDTRLILTVASMSLCYSIIHQISGRYYVIWKST